MAPAVAHKQQFRRLARRNRVVAALRVLVPLGGVLVLAALSIQIVISTLTGRFGIDRVTITPEAIALEGPEYAGVLEDGSIYTVSAIGARASLANTELIHLTEAQLVVHRSDGVRFQADSASAILDTNQQTVAVEGVADISDSRGMTGTLKNSIFDWKDQILTTHGDVVINQADGTTVLAEGLVYDASAVVWTFNNSVVTLPSTPGEKIAPQDSGETDQ